MMLFLFNNNEFTPSYNEFTPSYKEQEKMSKLLHILSIFFLTMPKILDMGASSPRPYLGKPRYNNLYLKISPAKESVRNIISQVRKLIKKNTA